MIVVVLHTFKWFSLPMLAAALLGKEARASCGDGCARCVRCCPLLSVQRKVIRSDVLIMLVVTVLVVVSNIVIAVCIGVGLSAIAWWWLQQAAVRATIRECMCYRHRC